VGRAHDAKEYVWFKWFPGKASADLEFCQLTLEEEGMYHRLLDLAARSTPNSKRGWLYSQGRVLQIETLAALTRTPLERLSGIVEALIERGLMARSNVRALGFPSFRKLQRHMDFRDNRDRSESQQSVNDIPTDSQQTPNTLPALDAEAEADADAEADAHEKNPPTPQGGSVVPDFNSGPDLDDIPDHIRESTKMVPAAEPAEYPAAGPTTLGQRPANLAVSAGQTVSGQNAGKTRPDTATDNSAGPVGTTDPSAAARNAGGDYGSARPKPNSPGILESSNGDGKRIAAAADVYWNRCPNVGRRMTLGDTHEMLKALHADGWSLDRLDRFSKDGPVSCVASTGIFAIHAKAWNDKQPKEKPKVREFKWVNKGTDQKPIIEKVYDDGKP
jgi:hypothetical protein